MKAMIFAAGLGTRLRPLTDNMPKALVPVAGKPMLERVILRLKKAGFDDITINIHHFGGQIVEFLHANNSFGLNIHISDERDMLLDTGGGVKKACPFLDGNEPFLVHNADILTDIDLTTFYRHHQDSNAEATLLVSERKTSRYLLFDDSYNLHGWINKSTQEIKPEGFNFHEGDYKELAFGGIHVISPSLFRYMKNEQWTGKFSIIPFYLSICQHIPIQGYPLQGFQWFDIGKPETLAKAEEYYANANINI
ncbi:MULTISPECIES: nucleotidyltransferase family protein [Bacteroides]|jgi:MurNAc alpha-1-phosphate uridylyltransferase|uniref:nucleotidyltransferase family protein n=1 Tax=Bacteroides TaxID=816 RepID=UPI000C75878C|nr:MULTISPECIES: nucleotidyltransferase family protein [Bacteroides]RGM44798.1 nucleotidyltransferase family protein [Bacteroides sp. OM08-11]